MSDRNSSTKGDSGRQPKVVRLINKYELDEIGEEMERLWTADSDDRKSLRELAAFFNQRLLKTAMAAEGLETLDGEVENIYRLLLDNDVREADRMRTRRRLEREGVDIDELTSDFVTYQAIRSYLKDTRGAEYTPNDRDPLEREAENFQKIRGRTVSITEGKLEQLRSSDQLSLGTFRTFVEISVVCEDCGTRYEVAELLDRGRCECEPNQE
jgi:hypothetical protein